MRSADSTVTCVRPCAAREHGPPDDQPEHRDRAECFQQNEPTCSISFRCAASVLAAGNSRRSRRARRRRCARRRRSRAASRRRSRQAAAPAGPATAALPRPMLRWRPPPIVRARSRWVPASWARAARLGGRPQRRALAGAAARLRAAGARLGAAVRAGARRGAPAFSDAATRAWLQAAAAAVPGRVARRRRRGPDDRLLRAAGRGVAAAARAFRVPLYAPPPDLATRKPYWTRQQIDSMPAAQASLRGRAIAYVADPLDALILQIQGSGRLQIIEADGTRRLVRVAFAGHNDQPYKSVGRWLIDQGELTAAQASWPAHHGLGAREPEARQRDAVEQPALRVLPRGAAARSATRPEGRAGRAADARPLDRGRSAQRPVRHAGRGWTPPSRSRPRRCAALVMAQDTGSAITGAVRADYFWGWGDDRRGAGRPHEAAAAAVGAVAEGVAAGAVTGCAVVPRASAPAGQASNGRAASRVVRQPPSIL